MGHYGVSIQYERSFKWKVGNFRTLCSVSTCIYSIRNVLYTCNVMYSYSLYTCINVFFSEL